MECVQRAERRLEAADQLASTDEVLHFDRQPRVSFGREIDPSSHLWVDRTTPGGEGSRVGVSSGLDPVDPQRRTLVAALSGASPRALPGDLALAASVGGRRAERLVPLR